MRPAVASDTNNLRSRADKRSDERHSVSHDTPLLVVASGRMPLSLMCLEVTVALDVHKAREGFCGIKRLLAAVLWSCRQIGERELLHFRSPQSRRRHYAV